VPPSTPGGQPTTKGKAAPYPRCLRPARGVHHDLDRSVDLKRGYVHLGAADTKNGEGRLIPLNRTLLELFSTIPRDLGCPYVFPHPGKVDAWQANPEAVDVRYHRTYISHRFALACHKAGGSNVRFHDLRHTFVTNARRAGIDYFRIMAISGHKTMLVFKRYHTIDAGDLTQAIRQMDTYMDTMTDTATPLQPAKPSGASPLT
jgi:integrase